MHGEMSKSVFFSCTEATQQEHCTGSQITRTNVQRGMRHSRGSMCAGVRKKDTLGVKAQAVLPHRYMQSLVQFGLQRPPAWHGCSNYRSQQINQSKRSTAALINAKSCTHKNKYVLTITNMGKVFHFMTLRPSSSLFRDASISTC